MGEKGSKVNENSLGQLLLTKQDLSMRKINKKYILASTKPLQFVKMWPMNMYWVYQVFVELVPKSVISQWGQFNWHIILCVKHGSLWFCLWFYCTVEKKTKSISQALTSHMMIIRSSGGMLWTAWQLSTSAYALVVTQLSSRTRHSSLRSTNHV